MSGYGRHLAFASQHGRHKSDIYTRVEGRKTVLGEKAAEPEREDGAALRSVGEAPFGFAVFPPLI